MFYFVNIRGSSLITARVATPLISINISLGIPLPNFLRFNSEFKEHDRFEISDKNVSFGCHYTSAVFKAVFLPPLDLLTFRFKGPIIFVPQFLRHYFQVFEKLRTFKYLSWIFICTYILFRWFFDMLSHRFFKITTWIIVQNKKNLKMDLFFWKIKLQNQNKKLFVYFSKNQVNLNFSIIKIKRK